MAEPPKDTGIKAENLKPGNHIDKLTALFKAGKAAFQGDLPPINVRFLLGAHHTEHDLGSNFKEEVEKADLIILERFGWTEQGNSELRQVTHARMSKRAEIIDWSPAIIHNLKENSPHVGVVYEALRGTHKKVVTVDVPAEHDLVKREKLRREQLKLLLESAPKGSFEDELNEVGKNIEEAGNIQAAREEYMAEHFFHVVSANLWGSGEKKILMKLGSAHSSIQIAFERAQAGVTDRVFANEPPTFSFYTQAVRNRLFNQAIDREMVARIWLEQRIEDPLRELSGQEWRDSNKLDIYVRQVVGAFSLQEIEGIFNRLKEGEELKGFFPDLLKVKDVSFVMTETEDLQSEK